MIKLGYQEIIDKEKLLFEEWRQRHEHFIPDGVVSAKDYAQSVPRILFLLKEVNLTDEERDKKVNFDLRSFLSKGGSGATWNNIVRWVGGIRGHTRNQNWEEFSEVTESDRRSCLKSICIMNLKKEPGGSATIVQGLRKAARADQDLILRQFEIYEPDITVCCSGDIFWLFLSLIQDSKRSPNQTTTRGVQYFNYEYKDGAAVPVVNYYHPQAHMPANFLYYGLTDASTEILGSAT